MFTWKLNLIVRKVYNIELIEITMNKNQVNFKKIEDKWKTF